MLKLNHTNSDRVNFDINEASELLNTSPQQIRKLIAKNELDARKVGGIFWITRESIERYAK